jgi:hypothetical protein
MEALASRSKTDFNESKSKRERDSAEKLLKSMASQGLQLNNHVFHEYIRILVNHGELELARTTYFEASKLESLDIDYKTTFLLAKVYSAKTGDYEAARQIANTLKIPIPFLLYSINRWEKNVKFGSKPKI